MTHFGDRLAARVRAIGSATCLGLDPHVDRLPRPLLGAPDRRAKARSVETFLLGVIRGCAGQVAAVKPQVAFFEQLGAPGVEVLERVCDAAREAGLIVVLDAKRGDIGSTAEAYARGALDDDGPIGADAITLSPYLGPESMQPFLERLAAGKGVFVLVRTSNPGSSAWQVDGPGAMASKVARWIEARNQAWHGRWGPVGAVVAATVPDEAAGWRAAMPRTWFLVPGYGAQGGTADQLGPLAGPGGEGALVNSSRAVLYPKHGADGDDWEAAVAARCAVFARDVAAALPLQS